MKISTLKNYMNWICFFWRKFFILTSCSENSLYFFIYFSHIFSHIMGSGTVFPYCASPSGSIASYLLDTSPHTTFAICRLLINPSRSLHNTQSIFQCIILIFFAITTASQIFCLRYSSDSIVTLDDQGGFQSRPEVFFLSFPLEI